MTIFASGQVAELFAPVAGFQHIALAVSGGSDSMALLRLAHAWAEEHCAGRQRLSVLSVDHGLRMASAGEVQTVARWCGVLGIPHVALVWTGPKPATGLQAAARGARYGLMGDWMAQHGAEALLTGHTRDDQAETVLMRQARTQSPDALAGIAPWRETAGGPVVRPLLDVTRGALQNYLRTLGQDWLVDPSNEDERFERVRVRRALHNRPGERDRLASVASEARIQAESEVETASAWINIHVRHDLLGFGTFEISALDGLEEMIGARVLGLLGGRYGAGNSLAPPRRLRLLQWLVRENSAGQTAGGARFVRRRNLCVVGREAGRIAPEPVIVPECGSVLWDRRFQVTAPPGSRIVRRGMDYPGRNSQIPAFIWESLPVLVKTQSDKRSGLPYLLFVR